MLYDADADMVSHRRIHGRACRSAPVRPQPLGKVIDQGQGPSGGARRRLMRRHQTYARKLRSFLNESVVRIPAKAWGQLNRGPLRRRGSTMRRRRIYAG